MLTDSLEWIPTSYPLSLFEVAHFRTTANLAEGHLHRSLGHRPQRVGKTRPFWPKAIFTTRSDVSDYGLRPMEFVTKRNPGAVLQATVNSGFQPHWASKLCNFKLAIRACIGNLFQDRSYISGPFQSGTSFRRNSHNKPARFRSIHSTASNKIIAANHQ
jgi:hypothetical protein